ncbi:MAG TPA: hypothetical protein VN774_04290 [Candidatus Limnocylindrales bacterium]|nr:hypothetical protein [Candidatus Limnocylindrales bacterium]
MSLGIAWWNEMVYGSKERQPEPDRVKTPGPLAIVLAIAALAAFILMPSVHEGVSAVAGSWHPFTVAHLAGFKQMARQAEADHDAKTLAFLSTRMNSLDENIRLTEEAVLMDPSFKWLYIKGGTSWFTYNHVADKYGWMQKLVVSDPDNAVVYLVEASIRENEIQRENNYQALKDKVLNDPQWRTAMEESFAAPRYDSYYGKSIELQESMLKAHNLRQPQDIARGIYEYYSSGLYTSKLYSDNLLDQARQAKQKGDAATAMRLAWSVAQFAERARANVHNEYSLGTVNAMLLSASAFLQPLEAAAGHADVAKLLAIESETISRMQAEKTPARMPYFYGPLHAASIALQAAGLGVIFLGWTVALSALYLIVARFAPTLRERKLYRWACRAGRFAPTGLAAAVVLMAATYAPYLETVQIYFSGMHDQATLRALIGMNDSLYQVPERLLSPMNNGMYLAYFILALLTLTVIAAVLFLTRRLFHTHEPRVRVA